MYVIHIRKLILSGISQIQKVYPFRFFLNPSTNMSNTYESHENHPICSPAARCRCIKMYGHIIAHVDPAIVEENRKLAVCTAQNNFTTSELGHPGQVVALTAT